MEAVSVCRGLAHLSTKLHSCLDKVYRLDLHTYECVLFNEYILICVLSIIYEGEVGINVLVYVHTTQVADIPESPPNTYGMYHGFFLCGGLLLLAMLLIRRDQSQSCWWWCCVNSLRSAIYNLFQKF